MLDATGDARRRHLKRACVERAVLSFVCAFLWSLTSAPPARRGCAPPPGLGFAFAPGVRGATSSNDRQARQGRGLMRRTPRGAGCCTWRQDAKKSWVWLETRQKHAGYVLQMPFRARGRDITSTGPHAAELEFPFRGCTRPGDPSRAARRAALVNEREERPAPGCSARRRAPQVAVRRAWRRGSLGRWISRAGGLSAKNSAKYVYIISATTPPFPPTGHAYGGTPNPTQEAGWVHRETA